MKTVYDYISALKAANLWDGQSILYARAVTLERYYNIYSRLLTRFPNRPYRYREMFLKDLNSGVNDLEYLKKVIREMETSCNFGQLGTKIVPTYMD